MNRTNSVAACRAHPASDFAGLILYYLKHLKKNVNKQAPQPYNRVDVRERFDCPG